MTAGVTPKYTPSPARSQAKPISVRALGQSVELAASLPWPLVEWLFDALLPAFAKVYQEHLSRRALIERLDDTAARRQLELRENVARCERIGHDAAAEIHDRVTRGEREYAVAREIALRHRLPVGVLLAFARDARKAVRRKRDDGRTGEILELHRAGRSNAEIGRQLGISPQHAGRLLRKAQAQVPGAA